MKQVQERAKAAAAEEAGVDSSDGHACGTVSWIAGLAGVALIPASGGASAIVDIFGVANWHGSHFGLC
jgi:hypothetical protein